MKFIDIKTEGGTIKGKIAFYCSALGVTRLGFYWYLKHLQTATFNGHQGHIIRPDRDIPGH